MKKFVVLLMVLSVVCSSVFAFDGVGKLFSKGGKTSSTSAQEELPTAWETAAGSSSTEKQNQTLQKLSLVLNDLETKQSANKGVSKEDMDEMVADLQDVQTDVNAVIADARAPKVYVETGAQLGFDGGKPTVGAVVGGGVKFGNGLMIGADASYEIAKFGNGKAEIIKDDHMLDRFAVKATVGYQF